MLFVSLSGLVQMIWFLCSFNWRYRPFKTNLNDGIVTQLRQKKYAYFVGLTYCMNLDSAALLRYVWQKCNSSFQSNFLNAILEYRITKQCFQKILMNFEVVVGQGFIAFEFLGGNMRLPVALLLLHIFWGEHGLLFCRQWCKQPYLLLLVM